MKVRRVYVSLGLVVILVILFGTGFLAYNYFANRDTSPPGFSVAPTDAPSPDDPPITPFRELHEKILSLPGQEASEAARKTYIALIEGNAKGQSSVTIADCKSDPIVIAVKTGSDITLKNGDDTVQRIIVNPEKSFTIPPKQSLKIKADFGKGNGIYTYSCNDDPKAIGVFLLKGEL